MGYKHRTIKQFDSFGHKKRREARILSLASRSEAPENCPVCRNEQRISPTPDMYKTTSAPNTT